jgi:hypothetical protein
MSIPLGVALEMIRLSLGLGDNFADGMIAKQIIEMPRPASVIPTSYVKAHWRNYAVVCMETNVKRPDPPRCKRRAGKRVPLCSVSSRLGVIVPLAELGPGKRALSARAPRLFGT